MPNERAARYRLSAIIVTMLCFLVLAVFAHTAWAQSCSWIKEVWINGVGPTLITESTPGYFGVVVSDTIHVRDKLWCSVNYEWLLTELWDPDLLSLAPPDPGWFVTAGEVDDFPAGSLTWWGTRPGLQWAQLDKYLHVDEVGWVTTEISETVEFSEEEGPPIVFRQIPFYLQELVEGGDAPSSYNHTSSPMTTTTFVTGTLATFPVVWDWDGSMDPAPPSYGFCHYSRLAPSFMGTAPSYELDADLTPDDDGNSNIDPPSNTPDRDGSDDGVDFPTVLPQCGTATVNVVGENNLGSNLYLNAWADWNRDGDWEDSSLCDCEVSEWIIQGYTVSAGAFDLDIAITPCHTVPDPTEPLWVRFTLSEMDPFSGEPWIYGGQPYSASTSCFDEGETEDYYVEPGLDPECEWDKVVYINDKLAGEWDGGPFIVTVSDTVTISETLSCNFSYDWALLEEWNEPSLSLVDHDYSHGTAITDTGQLDWSGGYVAPGTPITLTKTLHVDAPVSNLIPITETVAFSPEGWVEPMQRIVELVELLEGGDAPTSHYHAGPSHMETYPGSGVWAEYPVVWDWDGTLGASPVTGYYGFCHHSAGTTYLGSVPSFELDADLLPDQDLLTNIKPSTNTADRDLSDDGVTFAGALARCVTSTVNFTGHNGSGKTLYLNLWADWNRDGDWEDGTQCGCGDSEWAIQDHVVSPSPIDETVEIMPCHACDPSEPMWIRVTLSEVPLAPLGEPWIYGGQPYPAPNGCFEVGETEDFLFDQHVYYNPLMMNTY
jgi:hypothetical protein